ncbi:MAG: DUF3303 family protein, partial [Ilumatobacter sp.]|uniref:DUF3303 family protein n=1 Tax=Ilumatobacter sp. TaxID=1967498 RepID=UPI003C760F13
MKYVAMLKLHPRVEAQQKAIELFAKIGSDPTVVKSLVSLDGLTSYHLAEADEPDLGHNAAFAPYFDVQMVPVRRHGRGVVQPVHEGDGDARLGSQRAHGARRRGGGVHRRPVEDSPDAHDHA